MSLLTEMVDYTDGNGLAAPNVVPRGVLQGSDNGPMFESEKFVMFFKAGPTSSGFISNYVETIKGCLNEDMLCRVPYISIWDKSCPNSQAPPDDYYAVLNGLKHAGDARIARRFLGACLLYKGALNNVNPGVWTGQSFLIRQGQLLAAMASTAWPTWHPGHILMRLLFAPFYLWAAGVIATSCIGTPVDSTDPRRLSWHLVQVVKNHSILCWLASHLWYARLRSDYLDAYVKTGHAMRGVAAIYYKGRLVPHPEINLPTAYVLEPHPFARHWID